MDPSHPETYPRRVLVTVSGLTPQIITETLYALAKKPRPFVPTEVHVITTELGRQRFVATIDQFRAFFSDYGLPVPRCDVGDVHVITGPDGRATDVRTPADNEHVGNLILREVLRLTSDPTCAVHASIAGGRKTMGFYLGYLMSMFGREQDRISHVLVSDDLESSPDFFYPAPTPRLYETRDGREVEARADSVLLSEIPFIRHRGGFRDEDLLRGTLTFDQAVSLAQRAVETVGLVIDIGKRRITAGGLEVPMQNYLLAFLTWFAERKLEGPEALGADDSAERFLYWYAKVLDDKGSNLFEETAARLRTTQGSVKGFSASDLRSKKSLVNNAFKRALGSHRASDYEIRLVKKGSGRYELALPASGIAIIVPPDDDHSLGTGEGRIVG